MTTHTGHEHAGQPGEEVPAHGARGHEHAEVNHHGHGAAGHDHDHDHGSSVWSRANGAIDA